VRITSARTRWGSCSGKGSLNFSYALALTPPACIEYVVVHELVHNTHPESLAAILGGGRAYPAELPPTAGMAQKARE
jgi:hypothetical protein